jgi:hypothetical protein
LRFEPVHARQGDGRVVAALDITVSAGEQTYTLSGLRIDHRRRAHGAAGHRQDGRHHRPQRRHAALAHAHGVELVPYQTQPTIGHMASLYVAASQLHMTKPCELNDPSPRMHAVLANPPKPVAACSICRPIRGSADRQRSRTRQRRVALPIV